MEKYNKDYNKDYNKECNKNFTTDLNKKYNIDFYHNNDNQKFLILKMNSKTIWVSYKFLCSYDVKYNYLKHANDMIIIEKSIIDDKISLKNIKNINDLESNIMKNILNNDYIGYVIKTKGDINFYFLINKIIKI